MAKGAVLDAAVPGEEVAQVVAVAAQGRRREVVTRQAGEERSPSSPVRRVIASAACIARNVIPRVSPPVCCVQYAPSNSDIASNIDCTP